MGKVQGRPRTKTKHTKKHKKDQNKNQVDCNNFIIQQAKVALVLQKTWNLKMSRWKSNISFQLYVENRCIKPPDYFTELK